MATVQLLDSIVSKLRSYLLLDQDVAVSMAVDHAEREGDRLAGEIIRLLEALEKQSGADYSSAYTAALEPREGSCWSSVPGSWLRALCTGIAAGVGINAAHRNDRQGQAGILEFTVAQELSGREIGPQHVGGNPNPIVQHEDSDDFICLSYAPSALKNTELSVSLDAMQYVVWNCDLKPKKLACWIVDQILACTQRETGPKGTYAARGRSKSDPQIEIPETTIHSIIRCTKNIDPFWPSFLRFRWLTWE